MYVHTQEAENRSSNVGAGAKDLTMLKNLETHLARELATKNVCNAVCVYLWVCFPERFGAILDSRIVKF